MVGATWGIARGVHGVVSWSNVFDLANVSGIAWVQCCHFGLVWSENVGVGGSVGAQGEAMPTVQCFPWKTSRIDIWWLIDQYVNLFSIQFQKLVNISSIIWHFIVSSFLKLTLFQWYGTFSPHFECNMKIYFQTLFQLCIPVRDNPIHNVTLSSLAHI